MDMVKISNAGSKTIRNIGGGGNTELTRRVFNATGRQTDNFMAGVEESSSPSTETDKWKGL